MPRGEVKQLPKGVRTPVLTVIDAAGSIWAVTPMDSPVLLARDLAPGGEVTLMAWEPGESGLLFARGPFPEDACSMQISHELVRFGVSTRAETNIAVSGHGERYSGIPWDGKPPSRLRYGQGAEL